MLSSRSASCLGRKCPMLFRDLFRLWAVHVPGFAVHQYRPVKLAQKGNHARVTEVDQTGGSQFKVAWAQRPLRFPG
eukprot:2278161-Amphidinium_carterae.3